MLEQSRDSKVAARWWFELQPNEKHPDPSRRSGNRPALARLRRCTTVAEAGSEREALELARSLGATPGQPQRLESALLAAIVLAHVRQDDRGISVARRLGAGGADRRAPMSPLRLSRLLTADSIEERLIAFRRVVALLSGYANVANLSRALLDWSQPIRIEWAFDYHDVPPPGIDVLPTPDQPIAGDAA